MDLFMLFITVYFEKYMLHFERQTKVEIQIITEKAYHTASHFLLTISFNRFTTFIK